MARLHRINPPGIAQHIIQRGKNRQVCFSADEDYTNYFNWLMEYAEKYKLSIHAYVLMTNHVHILATPKEETSIPKTMQSLGRQYVRYFNYSYKRKSMRINGESMGRINGVRLD
ncbi:MAG: transposase [Sedimenticola sp.]